MACYTWVTYSMEAAVVLCRIDRPMSTGLMNVAGRNLFSGKSWVCEFSSARNSNIDTLKSHSSWTRLLFPFIFDKRYSLFAGRTDETCGWKSAFGGQKPTLP